MDRKTVVIATGGWDPLHIGHIVYLQAAACLGNMLVVGVNSDAWLVRKKGKPFLPFLERYVIMSNLRMVDRAIGFRDDDDTAIDCIREVRRTFPKDWYDLIFANGGDRTIKNIPELKCEKEFGVRFVFGVGGSDKRNSSSDILAKWTTRKGAERLSIPLKDLKKNDKLRYNYLVRNGLIKTSADSRSISVKYKP